jgi:hypothetical protein
MINGTMLQTSTGSFHDLIEPSAGDSCPNHAEWILLEKISRSRDGKQAYMPVLSRSKLRARWQTLFTEMTESIDLVGPT